MVFVELKGVVTRILGRDSFTCTLHDGTRATEFTSRQFVQPGESVRVACNSEERAGKAVLVAERVEKIPDMYAEVESRLCESAQLREIVPFDAAVEALMPDFKTVAGKLQAAQQLGRYITVKFHGDADGVCSALILRKFLRANYMQQNSAIYAVGDAIRDMERMTQHFRPLLVLLDFGSGQDSAEGVRLAKAAGIEILSIDHHPPGAAPGPVKGVNPWNVPGIEDGSKYPAGFLCSALASLLGTDSGGLEKIACAGDKSSIIPVSKQDRERALALDFVASYSGFGNGIDFYAEVLANTELFDSILLQANSKLEEADLLIRGAIKSRRAGKAEVYWLNLDSIAEKKEFPNRGKITSRAFELVNNPEKPIAVIGYSKRTLVFRFNDAAVSAGIRADAIIRAMKGNFSDFVDNGGGHARAAALRIAEGFESAAIEEIIKIIAQL
ncbi:Uncharacterised protein [uncultured archaeon]|nr:Uncharacterised protein [uncultured archaeon]